VSAHSGELGSKEGSNWTNKAVFEFKERELSTEETKESSEGEK